MNSPICQSRFNKQQGPDPLFHHNCSFLRISAIRRYAFQPISFFVLAFFANGLWSADWKNVPGTYYKYDAASITREDDGTYFVWAYYVLPREELEALKKTLSASGRLAMGNYSYSIDRIKIDCKNKRVGPGGQYIYSRDGNPIASLSIAMDDKYITLYETRSGTHASKIIQALCQSMR